LTQESHMGLSYRVEADAADYSVWSPIRIFRSPRGTCHMDQAAVVNDDQGMCPH